MRCTNLARWIAFSLLFLALDPTGALAQYVPGMGGRGFGGRGNRRRFFEQMQQNMTTPPVVNPDNKPKEEKKEEKKEEPKKEEGPKPVTRPPAPPNTGNLRDQRLTVDDKRMVSLNFQEAPWPFVMEEIAKVSGMSLDWQQLPGDTLNLRSNGKYTVAQARDMINAHLMSRGYATVVDSKNATLEVLHLDNLDTALVPRVSVDDLERLPPHDLVKVSFRLEWLLAKDAAEEFKQMLSPKAKLLPLKSTNRLEAIDAVANLKELAAVLDEEQGKRGTSRLVQEFELRYTRAPEVLDQLQVFLGLKKDSSLGPQKGPQQPMIMMPMPGQPGQPPQPNQGPPKPEVRLMADQRRNTILVNAPPDQMAIVKEAIYKMDVPLAGGGRTNLAGAGGNEMQSYRLATLDPEVLVNFLQTLGDLDPQTKLEVDKKNKAVIAYATPRDHKAISSFVKSLDGSDRELKVIKLRRIPADDAAGTLRTLLVGDDKSTNNNNNGGYRRFGWFGGFNSGNNDEQTTTTKFRVDADVANNRLIVWANQIEYEQVMKCLAELGEIPRHDRNNETLRVLDLGGGEDEQQTIEKLRRVWSNLKGGNKLIIDLPKKEEPSPEQTNPDKPAQDQPVPRATSTRVPSAHVSPKEAARVQFVGLEKTSTGTPLADGSTPAASSPLSTGARAQTPGEKSPAVRNSTSRNRKADDRPVQGAPIVITRGGDGRLIVSSQDTEALDNLEEVIAKLSPPKKDYAVYYLTHASATSVKFNLDDFFETSKKETGEDRFRRWWYDDYSSDKKDDSPKMSRRRPLRFIDDPQTNSILVQGGTPDQLRMVEELIKMYDRDEPKNSRPSRVTKIFFVKNSKAASIAETIKDTFRDLLSIKDKAMESYNQSKNQGRGGRGYISYDFGDREDDGKMSQGRFSGYLSIGVDDSTNSLLISCASQGLMNNIERIVQDLDRAAVPAAQTFQVLRIDRSIDTATLQKKLGDILKKPSPGPHEQQQSGRNGQQNQGNRRGRNRGQNNNNNNNQNNESTGDSNDNSSNE